MRWSALVLCVCALLFTSLAMAGEAACVPTGASEELHYSWRLKGPLSWFAGLRFPTSGKGFLKTAEPEANVLDTELRISAASRRDGFYVYQSQMEEQGARTLMTYHGYAWRDKRRSERTLFDYVRRIARIRKENTERIENKEKAIPQGSVRDMLTGIYFLRQNAEQITQPLTSEIYSEGKLYPVLFRPLGEERLTIKGHQKDTWKFEITAAGGTEKKWPGGVRVWLSKDEKRTPLRIEIRRDLAALQLDLESMECPR